MLKKSIIELYVEPCNCGLQIRHNNGGNYHAVDQLHLIGDEDSIYCVILEKTTTREGFPGDQYEILTFQDGEFRLEDEAQEDKIVRLEGRQVRFRQDEAKIVYQNPKAFIEARKPHAEELADIARAFGDYDVSWEDFLLDFEEFYAAGRLLLFLPPHLGYYGNYYYNSKWLCLLSTASKKGKSA